MESNHLIIDIKNIENRIYTLRAKQVMIDRDLAELFHVSTKVFNQAVKRNINRFPETFKFQLSENEINELVTNCDRLAILKHSSYLPFAFTEYGVAMLPSILKSDIAIIISIKIIETFVEMRNTLNQNNLIDLRFDRLEKKQIESNEKIEQLFKALENKDPKSDSGIFFNGKIFDAYIFISNIIRNAKNSIILIDNYIEDSFMTLLSKRNKGVKISIYTKEISKQLQLDISKFNDQYPTLEVKILKDSHDRFLIIDDSELYHIGASLKDLGKKWFAFSKMNSESINILSKL